MNSEDSEDSEDTNFEDFLKNQEQTEIVYPVQVLLRPIEPINSPPSEATGQQVRNNSNTLSIWETFLFPPPWLLFLWLGIYLCVLPIDVALTRAFYFSFETLPLFQIFAPGLDGILLGFSLGAGIGGKAEDLLDIVEELTIIFKVSLATFTSWTLLRFTRLPPEVLEIFSAWTCTFAGGVGLLLDYAEWASVYSFVAAVRIGIAFHTKGPTRTLILAGAGLLSTYGGWVIYTDLGEWVKFPEGINLSAVTTAIYLEALAFRFFVNLIKLLATGASPGPGAGPPAGISLLVLAFTRNLTGSMKLAFLPTAKQYDGPMAGFCLVIILAHGIFWGLIRPFQGVLERAQKKRRTRLERVAQHAALLAFGNVYDYSEEGLRVFSAIPELLVTFPTQCEPSGTKTRQTTFDEWIVEMQREKFKGENYSLEATNCQRFVADACAQLVIPIPAEIHENLDVIGAAPDPHLLLVSLWLSLDPKE